MHEYVCKIAWNLVGPQHGHLEFQLIMKYSTLTATVFSGIPFHQFQLKRSMLFAPSPLHHLL